MLSYIMTHNATPSDFNNYHVRQNAMMEKMKFILLMFHFVMTACRTMAQCDSQPDSIALPSTELYECEHAASHDSIPHTSSLRRCRVFHGGSQLRLQCVGIASLLLTDFKHRMGIRHRSLHGTPFISGHAHHPTCRQPHRRMVL